MSSISQPDVQPDDLLLATHAVHVIEISAHVVKPLLLMGILRCYNGLVRMVAIGISLLDVS